MHGAHQPAAGGGAEVAPAGASVRFLLPAPPLRPLLSSYYVVQAAGPLADMLHPEWGNARLVLAGEWRWSQGGPPTPPLNAALFGPSSRAARIATDGGLLIGIGLLPLGWARLIGRPANRHADAMTPLEEVWSDTPALLAALRAAPDDAARAALLDAALLARTRPGRGDDALVRAHAALLDPAIETVEALAARLGVGERSFERLCLRAFGFAPKLLLRRQRFLRTLARIHAAPDAPIAASVDAHYVDQAHFTNDFRAFMGMPPAAYMAGERSLLRRAAAARAAALGAAMQGLHQPG